MLGPHLSTWIGNAVGARTLTKIVWYVAEWPLLLGGLLLAFAGFMYYGPNIQHPRWRFQTFGAVVALASVVSAKLVTEWLPGASPIAPSMAVVMSAFALTLLLGVVVGLVHALLINQFRLPPFIATLATMAGLRPHSPARSP